MVGSLPIQTADTLLHLLILIDTIEVSCIDDETQHNTVDNDPKIFIKRNYLLFCFAPIDWIHIQDMHLSSIQHQTIPSDLVP
jgi:hypothetical protein